jgi:hypothetical protein
MSDDMVAFAIARIDDMENRARYCGPSRVAWLSLHDEAGNLRHTTVAASDHGDGTDWIADGKVLPVPASAHVIYDPAREIRKAEGMRAVVHRYQAQAARASQNAMEEDRAWTLWLPVAYLAAIWADHPDYQREWKP